MKLTRACRQTMAAMGPVLEASKELADIQAAEIAVRAKDTERASEVEALWNEASGKYRYPTTTQTKILLPVPNCIIQPGPYRASHRKLMIM